MRAIGRRNLAYAVLTGLFGFAAQALSGSPMHVGPGDGLVLALQAWGGLSQLFMLANLVLLLTALVCTVLHRAAPLGARVIPCLIGCALPIVAALTLT